MQCFRQPFNDCSRSENRRDPLRTPLRRIALSIALSVKGMSKTYHTGARSRAVTIPALRDVSLEVMCGEIVGLVGRPDAGKSSLLLCLAGLLRADSGTVTWFGE